jgi:hypothetical protein
LLDLKITPNSNIDFSLKQFIFKLFANGLKDNAEIAQRVTQFIRNLGPGQNGQIRLFFNPQSALLPITVVFNSNREKRDMDVKENVPILHNIGEGTLPEDNSAVLDLIESTISNKHSIFSRCSIIYGQIIFPVNHRITIFKENLWGANARIEFPNTPRPDHATLQQITPNSSDIELAIGHEIEKKFEDICEKKLRPQNTKNMIFLGATVITVGVVAVAVRRFFEYYS